MCRPPSTAASAKSASAHSAVVRGLPPHSSSDKSRALQAYICDLEKEKLELQRGLEKQSALVERLAGEHHDATSQFQAVSDERVRFEKELQECRASLAEHVRVHAAFCTLALHASYQRGCRT